MYKKTFHRANLLNCFVCIQGNYSWCHITPYFQEVSGITQTLIFHQRPNIFTWHQLTTTKLIDFYSLLCLLLFSIKISQNVNSLGNFLSYLPFKLVYKISYGFIQRPQTVLDYYTNAEQVKPLLDIILKINALWHVISSRKNKSIALYSK